MDKKKKLIIIGATLALVFIIGLIVVLSSSNNSGKDVVLNQSDLYGSWSSTKIETYKNGKLTDSSPKERNFIQIQDDKTIKIYTFAEDGKASYIDVQYTFTNNILTVEENDTYLTGERKVRIKNKVMSLEETIDESEKTVLYLAKQE